MIDSNVHGINLHSKYNPHVEARRYIESQNLNDESGIYLLIEPGHGYLSQELHKIYPNAIILEVHCDTRFQNPDIFGSLYCWTPDSDVSLKKFLSTHISDFDLGLIHVVEWKPSLQAYGDSYEQILRTVISFLQERRGNVHTTGKFGFKWISNMCNRVLRMKSVLIPELSGLPILIAASGPSLIRSISIIRRFLSHISLWALPSSVNFLMHHDILPDIIIHTDPGYYAKHHLRSISHCNIPLATPLLSAVSENERSAIILNNQTLMEQFVIDALDIPSLHTISHGTVSGTALFLALVYSDLPIFFAGLDLSFKDIQGHCRPHSFDSLFLSMCNRNLPLTGMYYSISPRVEENFAFNRYSEWFGSLILEKGQTVYRLFPSDIDIPSFINIHTEKAFRKVMDNSKRLSQIDGETGFGSGFSSYQVETNAGRDALLRYLCALREQYGTLQSGSYDISALHLLEEFITFCCSADVFRINTSSWKYGQRLRNADTRELYDSIETMLDKLERKIEISG